MNKYFNISTLVFMCTPNYLFTIAKQASLSRCLILQRQKDE